MSPSPVPASMSRSETTTPPAGPGLPERGPRSLADPHTAPSRAIAHDVGVAVWLVCLVLLFTGVLPQA